jgi:hypothetical protein
MGLKAGGQLAYLPQLLMQQAVRIAFFEGESIAFDQPTEPDVDVALTGEFPLTGMGAYQTQFKPDGTKLWINDNDQAGKVFEYAMTTPWDLTTATATGVELSSGWDFPFFSIIDDGNKVLLMDWGDKFFRLYNLGAPWDISTMPSTPASQMKAWDANAVGSVHRNAPYNNYDYVAKLDPAMKRFYWVASNNYDLCSVELETAGDLSSAAIESTLIRTAWAGADISHSFSFDFSESGHYFIGEYYTATENFIKIFYLPVAWDISTMVELYTKALGYRKTWTLGAHIYDNGYFVHNNGNGHIFQYKVVDFADFLVMPDYVSGKAGFEGGAILEVDQLGQSLKWQGELAVPIKSGASVDFFRLITSGAGGILAIQGTASTKLGADLLLELDEVGGTTAIIREIEIRLNGFGG